MRTGRASTLLTSGTAGSRNGERAEVGGQALLRRLHQRAVEGGGDGQRSARLAPAALQPSMARSTAAAWPAITIWPGALRLAGDHHLALAAVAQASSTAAQVEAEDRGHRTLAHRHRLLHVLAARGAP